MPQKQPPASTAVCRPGVAGTSRAAAGIGTARSAAAGKVRVKAPSATTAPAANSGSLRVMGVMWALDAPRATGAPSGDVRDRADPLREIGMHGLRLHADQRHRPEREAACE